MSQTGCCSDGNRQRCMGAMVLFFRNSLLHGKTAICFQSQTKKNVWRFYQLYHFSWIRVTHIVGALQGLTNAAGDGDTSLWRHSGMLPYPSFQTSATNVIHVLIYRITLYSTSRLVHTMSSTMYSSISVGEVHYLEKRGTVLNPERLCEIWNV